MAKLGEQESKILFSLDPEVFKGFENVRRMFDMHRDEMMNLRTASETFRRVAESLSKPSEAMIESQRSMLRFSEEIKRTNAEAFANIVKLSPVELPAISAISASLAAAQKQYAAMSSVRLPDTLCSLKFLP